MIETITSARPSPPSGRGALARLEVRRYACHPIFLAGVALTAVFLYLCQRTPVSEINTVTVYPAIFLGGFGMMAAFSLTRSTRRSAEALDVTPTTLPARTAALFAVAIVPPVLGVLSLLAYLKFQPVAGSWVYGAFSTSDRAGVLAGQMVVPPLGGALLGVALGRWVRFGGTAFAVFLFLYGWVTLTGILAWAHNDAWPLLVLRVFAPFTFFTLTSSPTEVLTQRGSPWFFVGWQLCLCAVAALVALLRGADPRLKGRLIRALAGVGVVAVLMFVLTVTGGWGHVVITQPGS